MCTLAWHSVPTPGTLLGGLARETKEVKTPRTTAFISEISLFKFSSHSSSHLDLHLVGTSNGPFLAANNRAAVGGRVYGRVGVREI